MAALPLKVSHNEQYSVICFRWAKGHSANASQSEMRPVYGNECFKRPAIHVFGVKFAHGHDESVVDEEGPGRRVFSTTDATITAVDSLMRSDRVWWDRCLYGFGRYIAK